jgi:hypothetical protein
VRNTQGPHAPEKIEKPEHLDQHAGGGPFQEDEEDATEKTRRPTQLVPAREKVERLLRADDEEEAAQEEDLRTARGVNRGVCDSWGFIGNGTRGGEERGEMRARFRGRGGHRQRKA